MRILRDGQTFCAGASRPQNGITAAAEPAAMKSRRLNFTTMLPPLIFVLRGAYRIAHALPRAEWRGRLAQFRSWLGRIPPASRRLHFISRRRRGRRSSRRAPALHQAGYDADRGSDDLAGDELGAALAPDQVHLALVEGLELRPVADAHDRSLRQPLLEQVHQHGLALR